jgi:hypothetical protein
MQPFEFLTLSEAEAALIVDSLQGLYDSDIAPAQSLAFEVHHAVREAFAGERYQVDGEFLIARVASLSDDQAQAVIDASAKYWALMRNGLSRKESLSEAGLL